MIVWTDTLMPEVNANLDLSHLLAMETIEAANARVAVARHAPSQPQLQRALPWLAAENHEIYNAYQQAQKPDATVLRHAAYLVSGIGHRRDALFIGLYKVLGSRSLSFDEYWQISENQELKRLGMTWEDETASVTWFDLKLQSSILQQWKGKLIFE